MASQIVASAIPDGYTLIMVSSGHASSVSLYSKLPYDTVRDFAGISQVTNVSQALVVGKGLGVKSVKELIALAKSKSSAGSSEPPARASTDERHRP